MSQTIIWDGRPEDFVKSADSTIALSMRDVTRGALACLAIVRVRGRLALAATDGHRAIVNFIEPLGTDRAGFEVLCTVSNTDWPVLRAMLLSRRNASAVVSVDDKAVIRVVTPKSRSLVFEVDKAAFPDISKALGSNRFDARGNSSMSWFGASVLSGVLRSVEAHAAVMTTAAWRRTTPKRRRKPSSLGDVTIMRATSESEVSATMLVAEHSVAVFMPLRSGMDDAKKWAASCLLGGAS